MFAMIDDVFGNLTIHFKPGPVPNELLPEKHFIPNYLKVMNRKEIAFPDGS